MKTMLILSMLFAAACASAPAAGHSGRIVGTETDVSRIVGTWRAHVDSDEKPIAGEVDFRVDSSDRLFLDEAPQDVRPMWLRVDGHEIGAALEPYFDSAHPGLVYVTFEGTLDGDEMQGVVWKHVDFHWVNAGSWMATRK